ncbi:MAG: NAD-dependent epimerase/dehydratase family protein [Gemmatimonadota bacterium]
MAADTGTISTRPSLLVADPAVENRSARRATRDWATELAGRRYLVTGAAGFIGGHLFRTLHDLGLDVTGTVLHPEEARILQDRGYQARVLDLASAEPWDDLLDGVDTVFHIAARFQETEDGEDAFEEVNNHGTVKLARTAERVGVERFVHCSTVGVHGDVKEIPATEESPFNPMDHYHRTKLNGELAILEFAQELPTDGMVVTVNRPAMVYGPGDRRMLKLFKAIASGRFRMIGSGEVLAHLGYIDDQTESFLLGAVGPRDRVHRKSFNIASDEPLTLNELSGVIAEEVGVRLPRMKIPVAPVWAAAWMCEKVCEPFDIKPPLFRRRVGFFTHNRAFDLTRAREGLGYQSQWPNRDGIRETIRWYREAGWI